MFSMLEGGRLLRLTGAATYLSNNDHNVFIRMPVVAEYGRTAAGGLRCGWAI